MEKKRDSNLELYRILLMLAIISHHYVVNSGLMQVIQSEPWSVKSVFFHFFGMWGKTGINCFVLITGYFMCKSKITLKKFLKLLLMIEYYRIIIFLIFFITGLTSPSVIDFLLSLNPISSISDGFVSCFLLFYLFIPFLNILINGMNQRQHQILIALCLFIYTIMGTLLNSRLQFNYISWFCILYFISSYIRLYDVCADRNIYYFGGRLALFVLAAIIIEIPLCQMTNFRGAYWLVSDSNHILAVVISVYAFMFFLRLKVPYSKTINLLASSVFAVFLIHAGTGGEVMRNWLWKDLVGVVDQYSSSYCILWAFLSVCGIFIICTLIDQIRIYLFEKPFFRLYDNRLDKHLKEWKLL